MSIVSTTGLGSGIDIQSIVKQLVTAEGQPQLNAIKRQESTTNTRLSGLGTLKNALSDFQNAVNKLKDNNLFKAHTASSSDETILKASAGSGSISGTFGIEVVSLARAQKSVSFGFASATETVGTGRLSFSQGINSLFDITIDSSNNTLAGIRDAINNASNNSSVTASIINVDDGNNGTTSKLVLTSKTTGTANEFQITALDDDGVNDDESGLSKVLPDLVTSPSIQIAATDAKLKIDGQSVTRSTNSITDAVQGLTLDLKSAKVGTVIDVEVNLDNDSINKTITDFVSAYNKLHAATKDLGKYGGNTNGAGNGALLGDATLRYISSQLRQDSSNTVSSATGNYNSLAMIGIKIDKDGAMSLDSTALSDALKKDLNSVSNVFASETGVANRLSSKLNNFLQSGGPLDSQQTSLKNRLSSLTEKRTDVEDRLASLEKSLLKQFTAMDVSVGRFNNTGSFLSNWIKKL